MSQHGGLARPESSYLPDPTVLAENQHVTDFLRTVVRTAPEGICVYSESPEFPFVRFSIWNDRMTELTGYTMAEINASGWYQSVYTDATIREQAIERMKRTLSGDNCRSEQWTIARKDGTVRFLAISTNLILTVDGTAVVALMSDVTERQRAELALRRSEARLTAAQHMARIGNWEWDVASGAVWWSTELFRLFGLNPATFRPSFEGYLALVHPDDLDTVQNQLDRTLNEDAPYRHEVRVVRSDGAIRWKRCEGLVERDPSGKPIRMWGTAQDVTEQRLAAEKQRALEDQLREARRLESLGMLSAGIAHEFNNLLTTILGHADLAQTELPATSPIQAHLDPIREASSRAATLCRKLLAYAGKGRLSFGQIDLNALVGEELSRFDGRPKVDLVESLPQLNGDAEQLRQMIGSIITNAAESGGQVWLSTRRVRLDASAAARLLYPPHNTNRDFILLEVRDDGHGMTEAVCLRAFEPFFSTKFAGRGLGLPVALGVVRAHDGGLDLVSKLGEGTTVCVLLPIDRVEL